MAPKSAACWILGLVFGVQAPMAGADTGDSDPMALLHKMSRAAKQTEYQGVFTYEHGSSAESLKVSRWFEDGRGYERLEYLNGPEYSLERPIGNAGCQASGTKLLQGQALEADQLDRLERYYYLTDKGSDRVAGRTVNLIEVRPRDQFRYGYLLGLDAATGLLLKALLIDEQQRLLERFQFVTLDLGEPELAARESMPDADKHQNQVTCLQYPERPSQWHLSWLPPGFTFAGEQQRPSGIEMLTYTDGLASFSVFLQPITGAGRLEGRAQRGATSAYMGQISVPVVNGGSNDEVRVSGPDHQSRQTESYRVTVVGEIPAVVAERVMDGIKRRLLETKLEDAS